jgi:hypothetical protein
MRKKLEMIPHKQEKHKEEMRRIDHALAFHVKTMEPCGELEKIIG